jgi:DNA-binding IscR family transcriptional regulator
MILALLKIGKLSMEDIAEAAEVSLDYIKKIAEELNKK